MRRLILAGICALVLGCRLKPKPKPTQLELARRAFSVRVFKREDGRIVVRLTPALFEFVRANIGAAAVRAGHIEVDGRRYLLIQDEVIRGE